MQGWGRVGWVMQGWVGVVVGVQRVIQGWCGLGHAVVVWGGPCRGGGGVGREWVVSCGLGWVGWVRLGRSMVRVV